MTPVVSPSIEVIGGILLKATAIGIIGIGVMGLSQAYHNPLYAFLSHLPRTGVSAQDYDLPNEDEREQLAEFSEIENLDIRIYNSDSKVPIGAATGFKFGPIGVPGIALTASAFDSAEYLSAIVSHELGHRERGDIATNAFYMMVVGGLLSFSAYLIWTVYKIVYLSLSTDMVMGEYVGILAIISIMLLVSLLLIIYTFQLFHKQCHDDEYGADRKAVQRLGSPECLRALLRLYSKNRDGNKNNSPSLISRLVGKRYPHPDERLERIKND